MPPDAPSFSELAQHELDRPSIRLLPETFCRHNGVAIVGKVDRANAHQPITVGMLTPEDELLRLQIADYLRREIVPVHLNHYEIETALEAGYGSGPRVAADLVIQPCPPASSPPTPVEIVDRLLSTAVEREVSDIHIETYPDDVDLRFRLDGILHQAYTDMAPTTVGDVVRRIKVLAGLDITEQRVPQDGRVRAVIEGDDQRKVVDFRISVVPSPAGEDVVIRILDASVGLIPVSELGMNAEIEELFMQLLSNPEGLILVTGPTGSGKTTTLYAAIAQINDGRRKIITAEDPIEYFVPKVNQKQVSQQMPHATLLRALLRQDPDVMLVGEVRDRETGSLALNAAATGHVVLGTLHTADAVGAVSRLRGLELDDTDIADSLLAVLAQRLVRRICPSCAVPCAPTAEERALLGSLLDGIAARKGQGCEACHHTGYRGRTGIFELLLVEPDMQNLIAAGEHNARLCAHARARGFRTLVEDALDKIAAGVTTVAELIRMVPYRHLLAARDEQRA